MSEQEVWMRAWVAAVQSGKTSWEAEEMAKACLRDFRETFDIDTRTLGERMSEPT